jgi:hypothetical protein
MLPRRTPGHPSVRMSVGLFYHYYMFSIKEFFLVNHLEAIHAPKAHAWPSIRLDVHGMSCNPVESCLIVLRNVFRRSL